MNNKKEYIHYGHNEFNQDLFIPISNERTWTKPNGGFWASPIDSKLPWKKFLIDNEIDIFYDKYLLKNFTFTLSDDANVIHIYSVEDLVNMPKIIYENSRSKRIFIDFEKLCNQGYDAIELHLSEERTKSTLFFERLHWILSAWDCDSILIMNPSIIVSNY